MIKILIIGKKSFLGSNLKKYLSPKYETDNLSYENVKIKKSKFFKKYTHVINTSICEQYVNDKYNPKYDLDINFIDKFKRINFFIYFLIQEKFMH